MGLSDKEAQAMHEQDRKDADARAAQIQKNEKKK